VIEPPLRRAVFVDTAAWYASIDPREAKHAGAVRTLRMLATQRRPLVVTNYVIAETYTLLRSSLGAAKALAFLSYVRATLAVHRVRVTEEWELAAEELLAKYRDHLFSYVDATSFVAMRELGVREVLTFDADFAAAGFTVLG
jgi:uncharacterized protein